MPNKVKSRTDYYIILLINKASL